MGFFLSGKILSENSTVFLRDIREGSNALTCLTERELCCSYSAGARRGTWRFPDGTNVGEDTAAGVYFTRGPSSLYLNKKEDAVGPTGVYTCVIPDAENIVLTLPIVINENGKFAIMSEPFVQGNQDALLLGGNAMP
jgi:phage baseplate assembly protein gpV